MGRNVCRQHIILEAKCRTHDAHCPPATRKNMDRELSPQDKLTFHAQRCKEQEGTRRCYSSYKWSKIIGKKDERLKAPNSGQQLPLGNGIGRMMGLGSTCAILTDSSGFIDGQFLLCFWCTHILCTFLYESNII